MSKEVYMERWISISVSNPYITEQVYRRILGELKAMGKPVKATIEGNSINIAITEDIKEVVWKAVKTSPLSVFTSINFK
ncbi:MAG: hypothetical protein OWQ51_12285 [Pyrobaculum arsenaticum]|nr:hypothetical protein [Pyrobaculum arsenaticum]